MSTQTPPSPKHARSLFLLLCAAATALAVLYVIWSRARHERSLQPESTAKGPVVSLKEIQSRPHLIFRDTNLGDAHGFVTLISRDDGAVRRHITTLRCERVHFAAGSGICLTADRGMVTKYRAVLFDRTFTATHAIALQGVPSRARMSPDGQRAGITVFVSGDSYAPGSFSTRTSILDVTTGEQLGDLEGYSVLRNTQPFRAADFNFWGVTFRDAHNFYATLGTRGQTFLIEGNVETRRATVIHENVECPSLSPDGTRVVFKRRGSEPRLVWHLVVLELATGQETTVTETRSVDDQAEWLDANTIVYSLPSESKPGSTDVWSVPANGTGAPSLVVAGAWSPAAVNAIGDSRN